ncbi:MAG: co-chaperone GroES [Candidatus Paceibacterota bacterium]
MAKGKNTKIFPLGDRVLIEPIEDEGLGRTASGIIIPETINKERPEKGKVIAVGKGRLDKAGNRVPLEIEVGQMVIFAKYGPDEIKIDEKKYLIVSESNILAVITD